VAAPKKYSDELRAEAVLRYREANPRPTIAQLARELGVHPEALRTWVRRDEADRAEQADQAGPGPAGGLQEELARLRKENAELRRTNEILKAAAALFAAELDPTRRRPP